MLRKIKLRFVCLLFIFFLLGTLAGCKKTDGTTAPQSTARDQVSSEEGIGEIEAGAELTMLGGAHLISITEAVLKDFMAAHPEIKINFAKYSYAEYPVKMRIQLSEGTGIPDIVLCHDLFVRQFINAGFFLDLKAITDLDNTLPVMAPVMKDDALYGLPNQVTNQYVFFYRQDIYNQLGLEPPQTYTEYFDQALILKKNGYFAGAFNPADKKCHSLFTQFIGMLGGEVLDENGKISLDKGVEALELIKKSYEAGIWHTSISGDSEEYWTAFNAGKIAAFPTIASHAAYYETRVDAAGKGGYGSIAFAPAMRFSPDGPRTIINNTEYFAVNKKTKYPNAAKMVLAYLTQSTEASLKFSNVNEEGLMAKYATAYMPGLIAIAKGNNSWAAFGGKDVTAFLAQNLLDTAPSIAYVDERSGQIQKTIADVLGEMFLKKAYTVEEAISEMRQRINRL